MKTLGLVVFTVILSCFLSQKIAAAYKDCSVECPPGCIEQKTCYKESNTCICSCDCGSDSRVPSSPSTPKHHHSPPKHHRSPPKHHDSPPKHHPSPPPKHHPTQLEKVAECLEAGAQGVGCLPDYLAALLDPYLPFSNFCCQNLLDVQTYCVDGNVPPQLADSDVFKIDYDQHCAKN